MGYGSGYKKYDNGVFNVERVYEIGSLSYVEVFNVNYGPLASKGIKSTKVMFTFEKSNNVRFTDILPLSVIEKLQKFTIEPYKHKDGGH